MVKNNFKSGLSEIEKSSNNKYKIINVLTFSVEYVEQTMPYQAQVRRAIQDLCAEPCIHRQQSLPPVRQKSAALTGSSNASGGPNVWLELCKRRNSFRDLANMHKWCRLVIELSYRFKTLLTRLNFRSDLE